MNNYTDQLNLPIPEAKQAKPISALWLKLAVTAFFIAGVYSLFPVILRFPSILELFPQKDIFSKALIIHVNLSVLVWFLAIASMIWSLTCRYYYIKTLRLASLLSTFAGTILISASPFLEEGEALQNNYVPILINDWFFAGLDIFAIGIAFQLFNCLSNIKPDPSLSPYQKAMHFGAISSALITVIVAIGFVLSFILMPESTASDEVFYERLFWAGGHLLQFTYIQIMIFTWLWLSSTLGYKIFFTPSNIKLIFAINLLIAAIGLIPFYIWGSPARIYFVAFFTEHMRWGGGFLPIIVGLFVILGFFARKPQKPYPHAVHACLLWSIFIFAIGGIIAILISGHNTTIPAHYHGSVVGITIALMGLSYHLYPKLGFGEIKGTLADLQPYCYGGGQTLHILGLAWMGGYGAMRKTEGMDISADMRLAMACFVVGGLLAMLGGLLYIIVLIKCRKNTDS